MNRKFIIDSAPGKELLQAIAEGSAEAFETIYELRKNWSGGYPFIHDRVVTYGFLDDIEISWERKAALVPTMAQIALDEKPAFFHCALSALAKLIPDDRILPRPERFGEQLLELKKRAEQFSFMPNIVPTWTELITKARCLRPTTPEPSYLPIRELRIEGDAFLKFYPMPFPDLGEEAEFQCPIDQHKILEEGNETCSEGVDCTFHCSAVIGSSRWWVFQCHPKTSDFVWIGYVYVRQNDRGEARIGHWVEHDEPISPEGLHRKLLTLEHCPEGSEELLEVSFPL